ncbi:hypothetical protein ACHHV8_09065 [Paenibacillus sp. TAB 01]|uniref:hypothetical protein n=1 Tax=Paenibacillus sp. TAB 01 TaxID=3368988 RepID=UPI0037525DF4
MTNEHTAWEAAWIAAVRESSINVMLDTLRSAMAASSNRKPQTVTHRALLLMEAELHSNPARLQQLTHKLSGYSDAAAQELAVFLLANQFPINPEAANLKLMQLADSPFKEVRDWSARAAGTLLGKHFRLFYPLIVLWTQHASANVRLASLLAVKYAAASRSLVDPEKLLDLTESLLSDTDAAIKKALGAPVLGSGLLPLYPEQVYRRMERWLEADTPGARWHIARLFATAEAAQRWELLQPLFAKLAADPRAMIRKAVQKAVQFLSKRIADDPLLLSVLE